MALTDRLAGRSLAQERPLDSDGSHPELGFIRPSPLPWERRYVAAAVAIDALAATTAGLIALALRPVGAGSLGLHVALVVALPFLWVAAMALAGAYQHRFLGVGPNEYNRVAGGALGLTAAGASLAWATQVPVARPFLLLVMPLSAALTLLVRYGLRKYVHHAREQGRYRRRTVIVGSREHAAELTAHLLHRSYHGYWVIGACVPDDEAAGGDVAPGVPVVGTLATVATAVVATDADTVAIVSDPSVLSSGELRRLSWDLERTDAHLVVAPTLLEVAGPRLSVHPVEGLPLLQVDRPALSGIKQVLKGVYETAAAVALLIALSPLLAAISLLIKVDSPGPVFFRQIRVGRAGREFAIIKFRTMVTDAEARRSELAQFNVADGPLFKLVEDPRVTRVGRMLRRFSLDELPQLWNVVTGQMSLVGPRPHLPEEIAAAGTDFRRRLLVKPGMTGLWQVSGRSDLSWDESVRVDLRYVENWSLGLDAMILWKTLTAVVRSSGAY